MRFHASGITILLGFICGAQMVQEGRANESKDTLEIDEPFSFLVIESRPLSTQWTVDSVGHIDFNLNFISEDHQWAHRYDGLSEYGLLPSLNLSILEWRLDETDPNPSSWIRVEADDLGLGSQAFSMQLGLSDELNISFGLDHLEARSSDWLTTPFLGVGSEYLTLPSTWIAAESTDKMSQLRSSNENFTLLRQDEMLSFDIEKRVTSNWTLFAEYENRVQEGLTQQGGAIYFDGSTAMAVMLPVPIDTYTKDLAVGVRHHRKQRSVELLYRLNSFQNNYLFTQWQNPFSSDFGAEVDYPNGVGALSQLPSNQVNQLQFKGRTVFNPEYAQQWGFLDRWMLQWDLSYSHATQREELLDYTVNDSLVVSEALPSDRFEGEVDTTVVKIFFSKQIRPRLKMEMRYLFEDRDNSSPREGYLYVRGDGQDQPLLDSGALHTFYNRPYSYHKNRWTLRGRYRLGVGQRIALTYQYETVERYNAAVIKNREDRFKTEWSFHTPLFGEAAPLSGRITTEYADRYASPYLWDQSYYGFLDSGLINMTPDNQRYINHPNLSQFHLSNREQWRNQLYVNIDLNPLLGASFESNWSVDLNYLYLDNDYDKTDLGRRSDHLQQLTLGSNWYFVDGRSMTLYFSAEWWKNYTVGRSFLGGIDMDAFDITPPLSAASDSERDWQVVSDDTRHSSGVTVKWRVEQYNIGAPLRGVMELELDYHVSTTTGLEQVSTYSADSVEEGLTPIELRSHHFMSQLSIHHSKKITTFLQYRYDRYEEYHWDYAGVELDTITNLVSSATKNPDDSAHFIGLSIRFRL